MFKLSITAGHRLATAGKRCSASLDPKQTREWVLNDRIAEKVESLLSVYEGIEILRTDDREGVKSVTLEERVKKTNNFGADLYLSIHHNAGVKGGKGGGIMAYVYTTPSAEAVKWQTALYNALIVETGLKGNRSRPLARANLYECRVPKMPSVLLELGFMDSATDVPIILTEEYADKCAKAITAVIVERAGLKKKEAAKPAGFYRVRKTWANAKSQLGAFASFENAKRLCDKNAGYFVFDNDGKCVYPEDKEIKVGDTVRLVEGAKTYTGGGLASFVYKRNHVVKQISGDRVVITFNGAVVAAVNKKDLTLV